MNFLKGLLLFCSITLHIPQWQARSKIPPPFLTTSEQVDDLSLSTFLDEEDTSKFTSFEYTNVLNEQTEDTRDLSNQDIRIGCRGSLISSEHPETDKKAPKLTFFIKAASGEEKIVEKLKTTKIKFNNSSKEKTIHLKDFPQECWERLLYGQVGYGGACKGPRGPQGDSGDTGESGEQGDKSNEDGLDGEDGEDGLQGPNSSQPGFPGAAGDDGEQGEKGLPGPVGPQGEQGDMGRDGTDFFDCPGLPK